MGIVVELGDRDCIEDYVTCWWVISGMLTLGTDWGLDEVTGRMGMVGLMCAWAVIVASRCWSWVMYLEGVVMPRSAAAQSAMACTSLSAGMMEGLVIDLC